MDSEKEDPLVFANRVIEQFASHMVENADEKLDPRGCMAIRVVFRNLGGSWSALADGSVQDTNLLMKVVRAWGKAKA